MRGANVKMEQDKKKLNKTIDGLRHCTAWNGLRQCQPTVGFDCPYEDCADCKLELMKDSLDLLVDQKNKVIFPEEAEKRKMMQDNWKAQMNMLGYDESGNPL